jgi:hypothetical protein
MKVYEVEEMAGETPFLVKSSPPIRHWSCGGWDQETDQGSNAYGFALRRKGTARYINTRSNELCCVAGSARRRVAGQPILAINGRELHEHLKVRLGAAYRDWPNSADMEFPMAHMPSKDHRISDKEALRISEETDVSPKQAKDLAREHGKKKGEEEARKTKDEG